MKLVIALAAAVSTLALTACGGGDGSSTSTTPSTQTPVSKPLTLAEGAWQGTTESNVAIRFIALGDNTFWNIYGNIENDIIKGFDYGSFRFSEGGRIHGSGTSYGINTAPVTGFFTGDIIAGTSISGKVEPNGGASYTFSVKPVTAASGYDYAKAAVSSDLQGVWSGKAASTTTLAYAANVTFHADGTLEAVQGGCSVKGTFSPIDSGRNVFNIKARTGASPCEKTDMPLSGVAVVITPSTGGAKRVILLTTDSSQTYGASFTGKKQ